MTSPAVQRVRAYFAPVARDTGQPTIFDPARMGGFALEQAPAPWVDLGWIRGFSRESGSTIEPLRTGTPAATRLQVRTQTEASVSFSFETWGKLQLALASGTQSLNLPAVQSEAALSASGGGAVAAVPVLTGSTAGVLQVGSAAAGGFAAGDLVAVDLDYTGQTGYVGSGIRGAYVQTALVDVDYIRRVSYNVERVANVVDGALNLVGPLPAGAPNAAMKISRIAGYCDREGASFFTEWSGLFVADGQQGERIFWYYPRLQSMQGAAEVFADMGAGYRAMRLPGAFRALPIQDALDGETVVCFRSYLGGRP